MDKIDLSIVVSVYNEEDVLPEFYKEISAVTESLNINSEIIFVNDGSVDNSQNILDDIAKEDKTVKLVSFSTNFGHEAAMIAGIDNSSGDAVICLDSDLQHPPSEIPEMFELFKNGNEIVNMKRTDRKDHKRLNKLFSKMFYFFLNKLSGGHFEPNASDFFLISKRVAKILKENFRERNRFLRGYIQILGFKKTTKNYIAPKRFAGESKYSFFKLLIFSFQTVASFSKAPLRLGIVTGIISALLGFILIIYSIIMKILEEPVSGYTTIVVFMSFMFSIQFILIGIIGEYIGYLFVENKKRPIYIIEKTTNF